MSPQEIKKRVFAFPWRKDSFFFAECVLDLLWIVVAGGWWEGPPLAFPMCSVDYSIPTLYVAIFSWQTGWGWLASYGNTIDSTMLCTVLLKRSVVS